MDENGWEARMAERAKQRHLTATREVLAKLAQRGLPFSPAYGVFEQWREPGDAEDIAPEILAARCLGLSYGDPGPKLDPELCRQCWGDRHVWLGNTWGMDHLPPGFNDCRHACHQGEVWLAAS